MDFTAEHAEDAETFLFFSAVSEFSAVIRHETA